MTSVSWSERVKCKVNFDFYQITLYVVLPIFNLWVFFSLCIVTINVKKKIKEDGIKNLDARLIQPKLKNLYMTEW